MPSHWSHTENLQGPWNQSQDGMWFERLGEQGRQPLTLMTTIILKSINKRTPPSTLEKIICPKEALAKSLHCSGPAAFFPQPLPCSIFTSDALSPMPFTACHLLYNCNSRKWIVMFQLPQFYSFSFPMALFFFLDPICLSLAFYTPIRRVRFMGFPPSNSFFLFKNSLGKFLACF